jgi:hypothetical protein
MELNSCSLLLFICLRPDHATAEIAGMSIVIKFHIGIEGGHIDIESCYQFRKILIAPAPN